ncbi:MAG: hypothetical protein ACLVKO_02515 [Dysgonomonas sp.]
MAGEQEKLFADLEIRFKQLIYLCDSLKEQNTALKSEIQTKNNTIESLTLDLEQLKTKYNNLRFAKTLASKGSKEEADDAKQRLNKLVREVDKCIALLKQ